MHELQRNKYMQHETNKRKNVEKESRQNDETVTWTIACGSILLINLAEMDRSSLKVHWRDGWVWTYTRQLNYLFVLEENMSDIK